jgi:hypothetical protein
MKNASGYWAGSTNGDGNGRITEDSNDAVILTRENIKFFEHLSRAKLVPESYTNTWAINRGYPALKLNSGKGMIAAGLIGDIGLGSYYQLSNPEVAARSVASLYLSVSQPQFNDSQYNDYLGVLSPKTIAAIDKKIDDGVARTGKFKGYRPFAFDSNLGDCLTGISGDYLLTENRESCFAEYIIAK